VVEIEVLPSDIPAHIEVDLSPLDLERPITLADLPKIPGVTYVGEENEHVFVLMQPRVQEAEETPTATESQSEPEAVARGKEEDEE